MSDGDLSAVGRTAFAVSIARAAEANREHAWFVDPLATRLAAAVPRATRERVGPGLTAWIAVRTRYLDELIVSSFERGVRQVVTVGAGLDARPFRLPAPPGARLYEVDRADVFAAKRRILRATGLASNARREVVADVLDPEWMLPLTQAGWSADAATLWILEGFLIYFDDEVRTRLLRQLAEASGAGSELGATVSARTGERRNPLWISFDSDDPAAWFAERGWHGTAESMTDVSRRYGRPLPAGLDATVKGVLFAGRTR
jgi:methyltransferase (TIGR00027 family)